ncbi:NAD(P)-binding domain-containing protein [Ralstonia solanacearum]|uniref:flavin-containing monooxygenase n=1 Tax=Ralstonia solanacearum TaxID=305 RepID=UPI0005C6C833|nr:NAD(P)-binding domain-containing protein [Ralstonia solanacearum]MDB0544469.1 NAD(P)-binding domain-containing protein [Ralstonia solanacearum]MDB0554279.1 NAD(P)-binding domain-containing protein [Ralstonia solanacearum]MDB0559390.1 NAD(P)-binding domain-containing protein [Ralstonia solanacearum]
MKSIAILGGGPAGLASAKAALEMGLQPTVFEREEDIGGIWHPKSGKTWRTMRTNVSRWCMGFSDYLWPNGADIYPTCHDVYQYLLSYATQFGLLSHMRLGCCVTHVERTGQRWAVTWKQRKTQAQQHEEFDFVIVATGILSVPWQPKIDGEEQFRGMTLHSARYKDAAAFRGKRVVVVGNSFSGAEIAADVCQQAAQVTNLTRRPYWIMPRYVHAPDPVPYDFVLMTRAGRLQAGAPEIRHTTAAENCRVHAALAQHCAGQLSHPVLRIDHSMWHQPPHLTISDRYVELVRSGQLSIVQGEVAAFEPECLRLKGGKTLDADVVIFCTGYRTDLSFLDAAVTQGLEFEPEDGFQPILLHKCTFNPNVPAMAFVGMYKVPTFAVIELQARWVSAIFANQIQAPDPAAMQTYISEERELRCAVSKPQFPHGDLVGLPDSLAAEVGVCPDLNAIAEQSPELYERLWSGPLMPAHYRLSGLGAMTASAVSAILAVEGKCGGGDSLTKPVANV